MSDHKISMSEYWRQVKALAKEAKSETKEKGSSREQWKVRAEERLLQTIDGHEWIIYPWAYPWVLMHSRNEDALFEKLGSVETSSYSDIMQKMAFCALKVDAETDLEEMFS